MKKFLIFSSIIVIFSFGIKSAYSTTIELHIVPISIWDVVVFEGKDWLGYDVVKIIITNEDGFRDTLKIKTTHDGELVVPWIIPSDASSGNYFVFATDRVNNATTNFEI